MEFDKEGKLIPPKSLKRIIKHEEDYIDKYESRKSEESNR